MATDIHANLLLEGVDTEPVQHLETVAEGSEDADNPAKDKKDGNKLKTHKRKVARATAPFIKPDMQNTRRQQS